MISLQEAVRLISSDKAKERSEGLELYKDIFQDVHTLQTLTESDDDGNRWLRTMQALFTCVLNDKYACLKKGLADAAPITLRRLKESAQMVQWTVEKAYTYYPQAVFIAVFNHLTQSLDDRGRLFEPLAIDYLKGLHTLLAYQPHMDHLDINSWKYATACCFNILLNETMTQVLDDCSLCDLFAEEEEIISETSQRPSRLLDAEVTSCLQLLVTAPNAPLVGSSRLGVYVLQRYAKFLVNYPSDSTAHLPALQGLNHVLSELEVNESEFLRRFAEQAWSSLLGLWSTKSRQLKEQVLITLHILLPFLSCKTEYTTELVSLQGKLLNEPDQRFALHPLSFASLELCSSLRQDAFQYRSLRAGHNISLGDAQSWATLELAADCTMVLFQNGTEIALSEPEVQARPSKRQRQNNGSHGKMTVDAIDFLVERAYTTPKGYSGRATQLWNLQILLFLVLRYPQQKVSSRVWIDKVLHHVVDLLSHSDVEVQNWSLLILASMALDPTSYPTCKQVWPTVCRRVMQSGTCRAASHAAQAILLSECIQSREILAELHIIFEDLEMQGPSHAYDSVCSFLREAINVVSKDVSTASWKSEEKALAWLQSTWSKMDVTVRSKEGGEFGDPTIVKFLLLAICNFSSPSEWSRSRLHLPASPIVNRLRQETQIHHIRSFVLTSKIPEEGLQWSVESDRAVQISKRGPRGVEVRCLNFIQKGLKRQLDLIKSASFVSAASPEQMKMVIDFAVLSLLFNESLQMESISSQIHFKELAHGLLELVLQALVHPKWSISDIAIVLTNLRPLLDMDVSIVSQIDRIILAPGEQSGIDTEELLSFYAEEQRNIEKRITLDDQMSRVWESTREVALVECFKRLYKRLSSNALSADANEYAQQDDDELWAGVTSKVVKQGSIIESDRGTDHSLVALLCISAMTRISNCSRTELNGVISLKKVLLSESDVVSHLLLSGSFLFQEVLNGKLILTIEELEQILETIGNGLLSKYKYEQNQEAQLVAVEFLHGTIKQWSTCESSLYEDAIKLTSYFVKQLNKGRLSWKVEKRILSLLELFLQLALDGNGQLCNVKPPVLALDAIVKSLISLNGRPDIRIRWLCLTMTARMYHVWVRLGLEPLQLYEHTEHIVPKDTSSDEQMTTRIITFGNALVACSQVRHVALYHLIELTLVEDTFNSNTEKILTLASKLLGFPSPSSLWLLFAAQTTFAIIENGYPINKIPFQVIGFKSETEMLEQSFKPVASMLVALSEKIDSNEFQTLATMAGKTLNEALLECISFLAASELGFLATIEDTSQAFDKMSNEMAKRLRQNGNQSSILVEKAISQSLDVVVVGILKLFYEPDFKSYKEFLYKQNPNCAATLERLEGLQGTICHEPCKPFNEARAVYQSIIILASRMKKTLDEATIYSVIHQMITLIQQERFVNEQRRHIYGLKLYICIARKTIEHNSAILRLLAHSCAVLMGIVDLINSIWPLFDWIFDLVTSAIPGMSSTLIQLSRHARRFSQSKHSLVNEAGIRLSERLGRLLVRLRQTKQKAIALEAICAWPTEYPTTLTTREYDIEIKKYTQALQSTLSISATFLGRISRALLRANEEESTRFYSSTIWTILDRLQEERLDEEEQVQVAASMADLLYQCNGKISSPSSATAQNTLTDRNGILTAINRIDSSGIQPLQPLKSWLARQLIELTRSTELESSQAAICCLRAIFTNEPQFAGNTRDAWEPTDVEDLRLITLYTIPTLAPLKKRKREELEAEDGLLKGCKYNKWIVWICELLCDLMAEKVDCASFAQLSSLISKNIKFAERVFAILLHIFLRSDFSSKKDKRLDTRAISFHLVSILRRNQTDKEVWKIVIQAIVQLRHDSPNDVPLEHDRWIKDVDYFLLQKRATECQLYATAVLFAELEHEHQIDFKQQGEEEEVELRLSLQYQIYSNIDDPDSFYGIINPDVRDSLVKRLEHEGQWDRLFDLYAAQQEGSNQGLTGIAKSLHRQGFNRLSLQLDERQNTSYGAAWRMGKWDLSVEKVEAGTSQSLYCALRAIHNEQDAKAAQSAIDRAFRCEYSGLVKANIEANRAVRNSVKDLLGLREINRLQSKAEPLQRLSEQFEFDDIEQIMSVRLSLLRADRRRHESKQIGDFPGNEVLTLAQMESSTLLALSQEARKTHKLQIAVNFVTQAQQLSRDLDKMPVEEEFASLLWDLGDHATAIDSLARIVKASQEKTSKVRGKDHSVGSLALALARLGQWRATARSQQPRTIEKECFAPATELVNAPSLRVVERASVFYDYATFANEQYQALLRSTEGDDLTAFIRYRREEVDQLELQMKRPPVTGKVVRAKEKAEKLLQMDQEKLIEYEKSKNNFRKTAIYLYSAVLPMTDAYDDRSVIRLISLWFGNADDEKLNKELNGWLQEIASRKFLPFVHQLSSRLTNINSMASQSLMQPGPCKSFHTNVWHTIFRMCKDHPFHALTPLYALARADDDKEGRAPMGKKSGPALLSKTSKATQGSLPASQLLRKEAATRIISLVATEHASPDRIKEWKRVCDACVQWARFDLVVQMPTMFGPNANEGTTRVHTISPSFNLSITRLRDVDVPVLTKPLPVDETLLYEDIVSISRYNDRFTTAGGVHLPKITDCIGSDGVSYRQLFKNLDDLRQDAVMQQVFGILNNLLKSDREAQKRQLRVRTYAVIPLGPRYGLLEFVGNTRPLHSPLMATHKTYRRKGDITPHEARLRISNSEFRGKSKGEQGDLYEEVCKLLPPTFRYHFLERYKVPIALLTSRLNYTRSVATTSIVGHILGLGDRHVSNILLDDSTGEVIHIDFGVAFDQGKLLPIPELVPFRLTRDMVDAMGLHGVEGVFRRCCQETLRVLREGASVIETVLQVFRYDPLYDWTQNPVKVIRAQAHASQEPSSSAGGTMDNAHRRVSHQLQNMSEGKDVAELLAERAIGTVMEKLSTSLSVEYTVNDLIVQARDHTNLGSIFSGWQAAL